LRARSAKKSRTSVRSCVGSPLMVSARLATPPSNGVGASSGPAVANVIMGVCVVYDNETWQRAKALDVPYQAVPVPLAFARAPSCRTLCCGMHHIMRQPAYARDGDESDAAFAYRVWMALTEEPMADGFAEFLAALVAGKCDVRPIELA